jgi:aryl-alcohol dehydrogenase-like predicted oxidoreductase
VDLIFCHRPDPDTPIEETVRAMDLLIKQGKAFYWGTSEWRAADIMLADGIARRNGLTPPSMEQPQYNLLERGNFEVELAPVFEQLGFGATIWSPLASGVLTGKYNDRLPEGTRLALPDLAWLKERALAPERLQAARRLGPVAADLGCTLAQMSLAWCLKNPNVSTVITGASRVEQLRENLAALEVVPKLADDVMERIERALAGD